ncbi:hypothetical protein AU255_19340 [Methyloprofundus sedimenti]|uniref:SCP domain-containing protein n=1 Tax=Methyloprofundus sedimenti TaxID=1420851 RepID=A0A1V8M0Q6_9GAMM|nr:CAP domain-containing protein [Methyloprofundus sedimenti]OQK15135.1 hypothetical protein AU255_19340 [Methyloprofundus sedimenti]
MYNSLLFISILLFALNTQAQPAVPVLQLNTEGLQVDLHWSKVDSATGYRLFYAPYPYLGDATINSIDLGAETDFTIGLWQGATFYVALQAYDDQNQSSEYSNIGFLEIQDRGAAYRQYWRTVTKEIRGYSFTTQSFLYDSLPNVTDCVAGILNEQAQQRLLDAFNQTRKLHQLSAITYDHDADFEVQQAALIQRANNFLSHKPGTDATCYSNAGFDGSNSSNLYLSGNDSDPANVLMSFIGDASNISNISGVGHRRTLLNPFLQFTSYGQVLGASGVKVFDFPGNSTTAAEDIPDYVAFPYLRYPYAFFSDKTSSKKTPWNLTIIEDKSSTWANQHNYFASAKISVTQKSDGQSMTVADLHFDTNGSGVPNNLSWTVTDWQYDTWYSVVISNIMYQSGETGSIQYDVFIDYKNIIDIPSSLAAGA